MYPKFVLIIWLTLCVGPFAFGQKSYLRFEQLSAAEGLPSNYAQGVVQDENGFLWIATDNGLARYDSKEMKIYQFDSKDSSSLPGDRLNAICLDADKNIWCGSLRNNGVSRFNAHLNRFTNYNSENSNLSNSSITSIKLDSENHLWICTGEGLNLYQPEANDFISLLTEYTVYSIVVYDNHFWVATQMGLFVLDKNTYEVLKRYESDPTDEHSLVGSDVRELEISPDGSLWVVTILGGVHKYIPESDNFERYPIIIDGKQVHEIISELHFNSNTSLMIGGTNTGLVSLNTNTLEAYNYITDINNSAELNANSYTDIFQDKDGNLWLSTYGYGLYYLPLSGNRIYQHVNGDKDGYKLSHNNVSCFLETKDKMIVGLDGGGINLIDKKTASVNYLSAENGLSNDAITDMVLDQQGNVWASSWSGGLVCLNIKADMPQIIQTPFSDDDFTTLQSLKVVFCDSTNRIWTANHFEGLCIYDIKTKTLYSKHNVGDFPEELFSLHFGVDINQDQDGNIWLGGYDRLYRYSMSNNTVEIYYNNILDSSSIATSIIYQVFIDKRGDVYLLTTGGIDKYNPEQNNFKHIYKDEDSPIARSFIKRDNIFWIASKRGILKYDTTTKRKVYFDDGYSMNNNMFNEKSAYQTSDGFIYFGGTNGYIKFQPDSLTLNFKIPDVYITTIEVMGKEQLPGRSNSIVDKPAYAVKKITLNHKQTILSLKFVALNYYNPEKNQYKYKLINFDEDWQLAGAENKATYTNLDAGTYFFKVIASNNDDIWNMDGVVLEIEVLPPFWETWLFRILLLLLILFGISFFIKVRISNVEKQKDKLQIAVEEGTRELREKNGLLEKQALELSKNNTLLQERQERIEEQASKLNMQKVYLMEQTKRLEFANEKLNESNATKDKFFSIIAHDLINPFNIILGFSELMAFDATTWNHDQFVNAAKNINTSAKQTFNLLENLLAWSRTERGVIPFVPENKDLSQIIVKNLSEVAGLAHKKNLTLQYDQAEEKYFADVDENMMDSICRNLLTNAIKFTPRSGNINVYITQVDNAYQVEFKDSGVGMPPETAKQIFNINNKHTSQGTERENGTGLGLILCKEFIDLHNGKIWVSSEEGKGSSFYVLIPKKHIPQK